MRGRIEVLPNLWYYSGVGYTVTLIRHKQGAHIGEQDPQVMQALRAIGFMPHFVPIVCDKCEDTGSYFDGYTNRTCECQA